MPTRVLIAAALAACSAAMAAQQPPAGDLRIVVIAGEGAVNIIQQKTAVAPIVEVRDRNNLPVSGATVTFSASGQGATFGSGSTMTVATNAAGRATATGLTPTAPGAVQVNVNAAFQGLRATAVIAQTNFATAAAAAAAGTDGGIGLGTIAIIGGAVAGGAVVATQTDVFGGDPRFIKLLGQVFATATFGEQAQNCSGVRGTGGASNTCYLNPVNGAVVSTTLDSATATTDGAGNFDLTTTISRDYIDECRTYTITIAAAGLPTYTVNTRGFSGNKEGNEHRQMFSISPPSPTIMSGC